MNEVTSDLPPGYTVVGGSQVEIYPPQMSLFNMLMFSMWHLQCYVSNNLYIQLRSIVPVVF